MLVTENLRRIRKEKGFTQKQLGERCGISESTLRQYEIGYRNPKIETIQRIANALEVPLSALVDTVFWGDNLIPSEWVEDENYKPILDVLEEQQRLNSKSDTEIRLPMEDAYNQVNQNRLLTSFNKLNDIGKEMAIEQVELLTKIPEYKKKANEN